ELRLQYVSLIAGDGPILRFDGVAPRVRIDDSIIAPARDVDATLLAIDNPEGLDWRGRNNLYSRIGVFLQPTTSRPGHHPVRTWESWVESSGRSRETGSSSTRTKVWNELDPMQALAQDEWNPSRAFRLASDLAGTTVLGARQGPFGLIGYSNPRIASITPEPRRDPETVRSESGTIPTASPSDPTPKPMIVSDATVDPSTIKSKMGGEIPDMPVMPPMGLDPGRQVTEPQSPTSNSPEKANETPDRPGTSTPAAGVIRTSDQFLEALDRSEPASAPLIIASDADWDLQSIRIRENAKVSVKAQPGATRPRIRFRPTPADPKTPTAWSVWLELRSGSIALQGIDVILAQTDSPRQGRWAGFGVWAGAELGLIDCTVSI
ncbi:serine/threonine-protein kinase, partial [Singulisphaera rosea]